MWWFSSKQKNLYHGFGFYVYWIIHESLFYTQHQSQNYDDESFYLFLFCEQIFKKRSIFYSRNEISKEFFFPQIFLFLICFFKSFLEKFFILRKHYAATFAYIIEMKLLLIFFLLKFMNLLLIFSYFEFQWKIMWKFNENFKYS